MGESGFKTGVVLLAAGEGSRMGGVPKCLLSLDGVPLIYGHLRAMKDAGVEQVVVVTGFYHHQIEPALASLPLAIVRNPRPEAGQPSSVRIGVDALPSGLDLVIIALADQPLVGSAELVELMSAFMRRPPGTQIVYPQVKGQRGNPVLFAGELIDRMRESGKQVAGRKFIDEHPHLVHVHETANDRFIIDLDTRDDLDAFEKRTGRKLDMPC